MSLTPQRKHRKLLKDGSGSEVWPESIEKVFVDGLRHYWRSPFATYSRGRSRYRNQFLVDYLAKAGIARTKKQVASHIQVLRNMWKGEPEFNLVAGGEELSADPAIVLPANPDAPADLIPFDFDDADSATTSPDYSPPDLVKYEFPPSPTHFTPDSASSTSLTSSPEPVPSHIHHPQYPLYADTQAMSSYAHSQLPSNASSHPSTPPTPSNRVTAFYLHTDAMPPLAINFDSHAPPSTLPGPSWPMTMKTKLYLPPFDTDTTVSQGFFASITLTSAFSTGTCITQVYSDQTPIHRETGPLHPSPPNHGPSGLVSAFLPDSPLARCRCYFTQASDVTTTLTQQIIVDGKSLLYAVHVLLRGDGGTMPSARLVGCRPLQDNNNSRLANAASPQQDPSSATTPYSTAPPSYTSFYQPISLPASYGSTTTSPAYSLTSSSGATSLTNYSYSPSLSNTTTGANLAYTYAGPSALPALQHSYTQLSSVYESTNTYGSLSASSVTAPSAYRRPSLSHGLPTIY